jgi:hypothetical protein
VLTLLGLRLLGLALDGLALLGLPLLPVDHVLLLLAVETSESVRLLDELVDRSDREDSLPATSAELLSLSLLKLLGVSLLLLLLLVVSNAQKSVRLVLSLTELALLPLLRLLRLLRLLLLLVFPWKSALLLLSDELVLIVSLDRSDRLAPTSYSRLMLSPTEATYISYGSVLLARICQVPSDDSPTNSVANCVICPVSGWVVPVGLRRLSVAPLLG